MHPKATPVSLAFAALLLFGSHVAVAKEQGHWCSVSDRGVGNCSFGSVARCLTAVTAAGGYCMRQEQMDDGPRRAADDSTNEAHSAIKSQQQNLDLPMDIHICRGC
jgi:hypothetical protein